MIDAIRAWAQGRDDVRAAALVGSWARGAARMDSDVDLVLLTDLPSAYVDFEEWAHQLGAVEIVRTQRWGPMTERRLALRSGLEVDVGIAAPSWASTAPLDEGTAQVAAAGLVPLHDPDRALHRLLDTIAQR